MTAAPKKQDEELSPEDMGLLESVAGRIARYRMEVPAILFLESVRPLNFVGSQALVFFEPVIQTLFNWKQYDRFTRLMGDRDNIDRLTKIIEAEADRRQAAEKNRGSSSQKKKPGSE